MAPSLSPFEQAVARVVKQIPRGRTLSYARVALYAGAPGGARAVVRALRQLTAVPWWRVVRSDGTIAPQMMPEQAEKLRAEGAQLKGRRVLPQETPGPRAPKARERRAQGRSPAGR